jgi:dTDP-4-amino-4,6-dideoxygalactose transaminase
MASRRAEPHGRSKEEDMPGPGAFLVGDEERDEVLEVLQSGYLSRYGAPDDPAYKQKVYQFEREFAQKIGATHAVAVSSGTGALMCALKALGIGRGDEVLVPGYTFIASISSIMEVGGTPVLTEVDESLTMDPRDAESKITPRTRAIMPVHMLGNPADLDAIMAVGKKHGIPVIEDCCQAVGGSYKGRRLGSIGALGAFSFNIFKVINSGDGGLVATSDPALYERAFGYHDQGHMPLRQGVEIGKRSLVGVNMRMNELTGAFLRAQLRKLDAILERLRANKAAFKAELAAASIDGLSFRRINDPGECATLLVTQFPTAARARAAAAAIGSKTMEKSGWHVYNNMEQILSWKDDSGAAPMRKGMLPRTDDILSRSVNLSVGVVDSGIGADFGITVVSTTDEIRTTARRFIDAVRAARG